MSLVPTLIESTWPENLLPMRPIVFPNWSAHGNTTPNARCTTITQTIGTDVDKMGRLWVLDNGGCICPPKLIAYNLLKRNEEVSVDSDLMRIVLLNFFLL